VPAGDAWKFTSLAELDTVLFGGLNAHSCPVGVTVTVPFRPSLRQYPPPAVVAVPNPPLNWSVIPSRPLLSLARVTRPEIL